MTTELAREELSRAAPGRPSAVTIGKFDGVHRAHQALVGVLLEHARSRGLASVVITLHPHPVKQLAHPPRGPQTGYKVVPGI